MVIVKEWNGHSAMQCSATLRQRHGRLSKAGSSMPDGAVSKEPVTRLASW
jgi:hypothetical protein